MRSALLVFSLLLVPCLASARDYYKCELLTDTTPAPPPLDTPAEFRADPPKPLCPYGEVPVPIAWNGARPTTPKDDGALPLPWPPTGLAHAASTASNVFFAGARQAITTDGADAQLTEAAPHLDPADAISLAEIVVESTDQKQSVMAGWLVDPDINGNSAPHLFVYHWVNGSGTCFNGCGWTQRSSTLTPGMTITPGSTLRTYGILHFSGNWWVWYDSEWIGYFPDSTWSSPAFTQAGRIQWLGQVTAASATAPASHMGNGVLGTQTGAARFANMRTYSGQTATAAVATAATSTLPAAYDSAHTDGANYTYGGPGIGCAPQCTGLECGSDGCGGTCGTCMSGLVCSDGLCVGGPGDTCANALPLTGSGIHNYSGDTTHAVDDYSSSTCGGLGRDRVYSFNISSTMVLDATVSGFDTVLYVRSTCTSPTSELICNDEADDSTTGSHINVTLAPGTYYLFVDGYAAAEGAYNLTTTFNPGCMAQTCQSVANRCGDLTDGCGGTLHCGGCIVPQTCGGGGISNLCGSPPDAGTPDAGPRDAGQPDAGPRDAGQPDAGPPDAGPRDAGQPDAGVTVDAGPHDPPDAGVTLDAGAEPIPDAGAVTPNDAGFGNGGGTITLPGKTDTTPVSTGCGCTAIDPATSLFQAGMLLAFTLRTRRRRAARE